MLWPCLIETRKDRELGSSIVSLCDVVVANYVIISKQGTWNAIGLSRAVVVS